MDGVLISVIMSVYNEKIDFLKKSIDSVLNQSYKNIQFVIVIDDPSNDDLCSEINKYADKDNRIKVILNEKNVGITASLNKALKYCDGDYVARMDSDDFCEENRLAKQLYYLDTNDFDIVGSETRRVDEAENIVINRTNKSYSLKTIMKSLEYGNCIAHPTWFLKKEVYIKLNGYRNMIATEDYDLLLRAMKHGYKIGICDEILLNYRINSRGISKTNLLKQKIASKYLSNHLRIIDKITVDDVNNVVEKRWTNEEESKYKNGMNYFNEALVVDSRWKKSIYLFKAMMSSKYVFDNVIRMIKLRIIRLIYK